MQSITQEWRFQDFDVHQMEYPVSWALFVSHSFSECICFSQISIWHVLTLRNASEREKVCLQVPLKKYTQRHLFKNVAFLFQGFYPVQWGAEPTSLWPVLLSCCVLLWFHDLICFQCCFLQVGFCRQLPLAVQRST